MKQTRLLTSLTLLAAVSIAPSMVHAQDFASQVVDSGNLSTNPLYSDTNAILGQPTTLDYDGFSNYHRSMVNTAYNTDPSGNALLVSLGNSNGAGFITVKFDTPIVHSDSHWYGEDFIVFGNQGFIGAAADGFADDTTDLANYHIDDGSTYSQLPTVEVSSDGLTWTALASPTTANGNTLYPENPYAWDSTNHTFGALQDFTKPVDPTLTEADFAGKSVADAIGLYDGSAGGTAFSLAGTGLTSIQYIRLSGNGAVVDGISRVSFSNVSAVPEPGTVGIFIAGLSLLAVLIVRRKRIA